MIVCVGGWLGMVDVQIDIGE